MFVHAASKPAISPSLVLCGIHNYRAEMGYQRDIEWCMPSNEGCMTVHDRQLRMGCDTVSGCGQLGVVRMPVSFGD
jgi:hypothetical protein